MGQQPFWKKKTNTKNSLPNAEFINKYGLYLPNHANLSIKDIDFICKILRYLGNQFFLIKCSFLSLYTHLQ